LIFALQPSRLGEDQSNHDTGIPARDPARRKSAVH